MIVDQNITTYIHSLEREPDPGLERLRLEAERSGVPVIRRETESFMKVLLKMINPGSILEVGTAVGYSAIFMAKNTGEDCHVTTIENYGERIEAASANIEAYGMEERITLIGKDAQEVLPALDGAFDLIFLDAAKGQYITFLQDILRLLPKGGILLADNVLQDGELVRSRFATPRRQRTIHDRMREFIWEIKHSDELETTLLTVGDGLTLSIRK